VVSVALAAVVGLAGLVEVQWEEIVPVAVLQAVEIGDCIFA